MNKQLNFVWIDDDPNRETSSKNLEKQLNVKCRFVNLKEEKVDYIKIIGEVKPDLILIDQNLTEIKSGDIKKGSTVATVIREKNPQSAIVCITGQNRSDFDSQQRLSYETVLSFDDITAHYSTMKSIAESFKRLNAYPPSNTTELLNLLKAPKEDCVKLTSILPHSIKESYEDFGLTSNVSHWIRDVLIMRPGFLYDDLWAATILGLNEKGFSKVKPLFNTAKYKGIFADESKERWWKSDLINRLSKLVKTPGLPWEKGRFLNGITKQNFSKDYYTDFKEEYPETVAFVDESSDERVQMKIKYTVPHPKFDKLLYFEDIRMMKID